MLHIFSFLVDGTYEKVDLALWVLGNLTADCNKKIANDLLNNFNLCW